MHEGLEKVLDIVDMRGKDNIIETVRLNFYGDRIKLMDN